MFGMASIIFFIYVSGVFIAEILNVIFLLSHISILHSVRAKNLSKVGMYYDLAAGKFVEEKSSKWSFAFLLIDMLLISPFLSWYPVIRAAWFWFRARNNKVEIPEQLKELQFKLASVDLPKIQVEKVLAEIRKIAASYGSIDDTEECLEKNLLIIDENNEMRISPTLCRIRHSWHSPDYDATGQTIHEYKIDGFNVEIRLIEEYSGQYDIKEKNIYTVKDNVVLESEIRERAKVDKYANFGETVDDKIKRLKKEVEWSSLHTSKMKYFILYRHAYDFSDGEFRRYIRMELERYKTSLQNIEEYAKKNGYIIKTSKYGTGIHYPDGTDENTVALLNANFNELFPENFHDQYGLTKVEFNNSLELIEYLSELVEEEKL